VVVTTGEITVKYIGTTVLALIALLAIGSVLAPFLTIIWAVIHFSLSEVIKGIIVLYILMIPVSMFISARKYQG